MFIVTGISTGIAERLWDSLPHRRGSRWSGEPGETFEDFLDVLANSKSLLIYDYAFVRVEIFTPHGTALCHPLIWSPDVFRNRKEILRGFDELANLLGVITLSFMIPDAIPSLHRLATTLGLAYTSPCRMPDSSSGSIYIYVPRRT
jgi:hypothetical protein